MIERAALRRKLATALPLEL